MEGFFRNRPLWLSWHVFGILSYAQENYFRAPDFHMMGDWDQILEMDSYIKWDWWFSQFRNLQVHQHQTRNSCKMISTSNVWCLMQLLICWFWLFWEIRRQSHKEVMNETIETWNHKQILPRERANKGPLLKHPLIKSFRFSCFNFNCHSTNLLQRYVLV